MAERSPKPGMPGKFIRGGGKMGNCGRGGREEDGGMGEGGGARGKERLEAFIALPSTLSPV